MSYLRAGHPNEKILPQRSMAAQSHPGMEESQHLPETTGATSGQIHSVFLITKSHGVTSKLGHISGQGICTLCTPRLSGHGRHALQGFCCWKSVPAQLQGGKGVRWEPTALRKMNVSIIRRLPVWEPPLGKGWENERGSKPVEP